MPSARGTLGAFGEAAAAAHLQRRGARIVARNWRRRDGEIDLVALLGGQLLFVEVRTRRRRSAEDSTPEESVGAVKAARMRRLAYAYLLEAALDPEPPWRIDLIAVEVDGGGRVVRLEQFEGAVGDE